MKKIYELELRPGLNDADAGRIKRICLVGLIAVGLAGLTGCGNYFSVKVPYQVPDSPNALAARQAMGGLYLVVKTGAAREENALTGLAGALSNNSGPELSSSELAGRAARALTRPGSRVCAWRVEKTAAGQDPFAGRFSPSGLLEITVSRPSVAAAKAERTSVYYNKQKQKQTVKNKVWEYSASISAGLKLVSWPAGQVIDSWGDTFAYSEDRADNSRDAGEWYAANEEKLFSSLTSRLVARYSGRFVDRLRPVFIVKKDSESAEAASLAQRSNWGKAEEIWLRRAAAAGGWRDYLGLAVSAELKKDYPGAEAYYRQAEKRSVGDKDGAKVFWAQIYSDLELAASTRAAAGCDPLWFNVKTAVLPFSDETSSLDGPPLVRRLVYERLKAGGYDLVPLEETDEVLRRHGYSEGGQLGAVKPGELAVWLGAQRLVYGNIADFGEIMAGLYNRRMVKGAVRIWEAGSGGELIFEESVVSVKTPKSFVGGMFSQLAKGLAERIQNKPLAYEAGLFSRQVSENLPNKP